MNCHQIRELLPDLAAGMHASTLEPEIEKHIASCNECASHLRDLQKTMALLDEWQAPEPSPYFDIRLQARLREEMARPAAGWRNWVRRPAWAMSLAAVIFMGALGVGIGIGSKSYIYETEAIATKPPSPGLPVQPGTAVGDLQALERNDELYADFDVLDDLQVQDDVTANP
jgi:predicted anti-sigma-YlaC factor YlaD